MLPASGPLITLLNTSRQLIMADLYEIWTISGVSRYTDAKLPVTSGGFTYQPNGPVIKRTGTKRSVGLQTDTMKLTLECDQTHLLEGLPFVQAAAKGALDNARIVIHKAFIATWGAAPTGTVDNWFAGAVSLVRPSRNKVEIEVKDDTEKLTVKMPCNLYQGPCLNTLFDPACGVLRSAFLVNGTATGGTTTSLTSALAQAAGWFEQGTIKMTSGLNVGLKRTVKTYAGGSFTFILPLPFAVLAGDTFETLPGCDKTPPTCDGKFGNLARNTSFPFIPAAEVAL
jgi:uncharacterized phage protein (TIGR02218 family)